MVFPVNQMAATSPLLLLTWTNGLTEWILWSIHNSGFFFGARGILRGFGADALYVFSDTYEHFMCRFVTVILCAERLLIS